MTVDDALDDGEADPGAFEFFRGMQTLERSEQPLRVLQIKTHSIVSDEIGTHPLLLAATKFDLRLRGLRGEFPCISDQIFERYPEKSLVAFDEDIFLDRKLDGPLARRGFQLCLDHPGELGKAHLGAAKVALGHSRESEQSVDQLPHALCGGPH